MFQQLSACTFSPGYPKLIFLKLFPNNKATFSMQAHYWKGEGFRLQNKNKDALGQFIESYRCDQGPSALSKIILLKGITTMAVHAACCVS